MKKKTLQNVCEYPVEPYEILLDLLNIRILFLLKCQYQLQRARLNIGSWLQATLIPTVTDDRLNGLAVLNFHYDIASSVLAEAVPKLFARRRKRIVSLYLL